MGYFMEHAEFFACVSYLIPLIPAWILFRKLTPELKFLTVILTLEFALSSAGYYTGKHYINNLQLYSVKYLLQFYLYALLFRSILSGRLARRFIGLSMIVFGVFVLTRIRSLTAGDDFDSYTSAFLSVAMLFYCVFYFNQQLSRPQITFIYKTTWFWVVTGLLLYFAGSFLILLTTDYLMNRDNTFIRDLWNLHDELRTIKNILIALGLFFIKNS